MKKLFLCSFVFLSLARVDAENKTVSQLRVNSGESDLEDLVRNHSGEIEELKHRIKIIEQNLGIYRSESLVTKKPEQIAEEIKGKSPEAVIEIAKGFIEHDRYAEARSVLETFIKKNPKNLYCGRMHFYIGKTYFEEKNYQEAAKSYMESSEIGPNGAKAPKALFKLSECFLKLGKEDQRKMTLEKLASTFAQFKHGKKACNLLKKLKKS